MSTSVAAENTTYIIGHRNPDADAICSAIAYAALKERRGETGYVAARCGNSNARIDTILERFHHHLPVYVSDVTPRVRDLMIRDVVAVPDSATCAEALELIEHRDVRVLPVTSNGKRVVGTVSVTQLGGFFIPKVRAPREMRKVYSSLSHISRALRACIVHFVEPDRHEELYVRVGAMDIRSFWKISQDEGIPAGQSLIIVGDRRDIQLRSIEIGVRAIVITGNLPADDDIIQQAMARGVSLIISPYDSATTAWVIRTATTIEKLIDRNFPSIDADVRLAEARRKFATMAAPSFIVLTEDGILEGILSKTDVLKPVKTRLVLVDHNEMTQAVSGADQVTIAEIIDHHRLGALNTQQPILFINEPVGSTCTIIADLFRRDSLTPSPDLAGIMMSGIVSDTLNLNSPTSTEKDSDILAWLAGIARVDARQLAETIFSSGSVILANPPEKIVRSDCKTYEEDGVRFAVAQVEELGFGNFWQHSRRILDALKDLRDNERLAFACLLVTDINSQNSLLVAKGDPGFIQRISYPHVEQDEIFDMPGIVSRKKQLVPYLVSIIKEMTADGAAPKAETAAPFAKS